MRQFWIIVAAAGALSACSGESSKESAAATGSVSLKNASMGDVSDQVAAASAGGAMFSPGQWQGTVRMIDFKMPQMDALPPEMRDQLKAKMTKGRDFDNCLTPQQAADSRGTLVGSQQTNCSYEHFTMAGGTIDAAMTCSGASGMQKMTMSGTYSKTAYHIVTQASGSGDKGAGMAMKMDVSARRTGECKAPTKQ